MKNDFFETAPVPKAYLKLALPVIATMAFSLVYNLTDTFFVARTGNAALVAGVSLCYPLFLMMLAMGDIFSMGGSALVSKLFGQKDLEGAKKVSAFSFYGAALFGLILAAVLLIFHDQCLAFLGAGPDTWQHASSYYRIIAIGAPFIVLSFVPVNMLRSEGLPSKGMLSNVTGTVVNIILDPLFILVFNMGSGGAALATVIGNVITNIIAVCLVLKKCPDISFSVKDLNISPAHAGAVFAMGIPVAITNLMASFGTAMLNRHLFNYGTDTITSMGIASRISSIVLLILVGGSFGGSPVIAYNYGAGNGKRLREILRFALIFEIGIAAVLSGLIIIFAHPVMNLFMENEHIIQLGIPMLRLLCASMPVVALVLVCSILFQSTGKTVQAIVLSLCRQGIIFVIVLTVLDKIMGYNGVIYSQPVSDVLTGVIAVSLLLISRRQIFINSENR